MQIFGRKYSVKTISLMTLLVLILLGFGAVPLVKAHIKYETGGDARIVSCLNCHMYSEGGTISDRILKPKYLSPLDLKLSRDGRMMYVVAQDSDALLIIDTEKKQVVFSIPVGRHPNSLAINPKGTIAYISNQYSNSVSIVGLKEGKELSDVSTGYGPAGILTDLSGENLFVANWWGNDISVIKTSEKSENVRLAGGNNPNKLALSPDGKLLLVSNQLSKIQHYPDPPVTEVTSIDVSLAQVKKRYQIKNAHLLGGVAFAPTGDFAFLTIVRPKNLIPAIHVERGWMMTNGIAIINLKTDRVFQLPLDDIDSFYADPSDIAVTPDGRFALVTHGGVDAVSIIDLTSLRNVLKSIKSEKEQEKQANNLALSSKYVVSRIHTGKNPRGIAISNNGTLAYVAERLDDTIGIIDIKRGERVGQIDLGGPKHITIARKGEQLFNRASIAMHNQFSCQSCHPNQHMDRLQYDIEPDGLGKNIVDNRSLLGIGKTGPFKWNGKNTSLYMQCGIRFARFLTRSAPFSIEELTALVGYISSLEPFPADDGKETDLTPAQKRGKILFERTLTKGGKIIPEKNRCITCHSAPIFTNRKVEDVGSASEWDTAKSFDTPQLTNLSRTAPYLHDGKAKTLEEIWTVYSPKDTHGVVSDLGKDGLNDLIEYIKML